MKATYKNIALAALALSAVACSQDDVFTSAYLTDPDAVRITAQVGNTSGGFTRSNPIGTEDEQKTFNSGDKIGVSAGSQAAVVYTLDADDKTWKPETDKYLKWESNSMNFTAWYPATDGTDSKNFIPSYNETASSLAELQANDYMTYSGEQNNTNGNGVNLTMERQMVRIVISTIDYNDQYNVNDNAVVAIAITSGSSKYENGAWTDDNITAQMYKHDGNWYAVLPPTATAKDNEAFLSITLNGVTGPLTVKGIPATKAGKSYDYTLTVGKNKVSIGGVSVSDWTMGDTIPGGEAEEIKVTTVISSDGTTATITVPELATNKMLQEAAAEALTYENVTTWIVNGELTDEMQTTIATALAGKTITLYLPQLETAKLVDGLKNLTVYCGYYKANNTYFVYNADGLQAWHNHTDNDKSTNLTLEKDIVLTLADGATNNWTSVGTESAPYTGTVDGNGYSITGMTINQTTSCAGFIGCLQKGTVKNLKMKQINITCSQQFVGGIAGHTKGGNTIENCAIEGGTIGSDGNFVGGIVGTVRGDGDRFIACYNTAAVIGASYVAGIVGSVYGTNNAYIIGCYNAGYIKGTDSSKKYVAGIIGCESTTMSTYCCYNTGGTNKDWAINGMLINNSKGCNYWSSNHTYPNGPDTTNEMDNGKRGGTKINDESEWITAMETMNSWLSSNRYGYRYKQNTDELTKATLPLMIVKAQ